MMPMTPKVYRALALAASQHALQRWGDSPYYIHLLDVRDILIKHGYTSEEDQLVAILHDVIEDGDISYNDLEKEYGEVVADAVFAVTEHKGRNRKERKPPEHYAEIKANELALRAKIADRISNTQKSIKTSSGMLHKYRQEYRSDFRPKLYTQGVYETLWKTLEKVST